MRLKAVQAGHAHVGHQARVQSEKSGRAQGFAGHGQVRGAGRDDEHVRVRDFGGGREIVGGQVIGQRAVLQQVRAQAEEPGLLPQASVRKMALELPAVFRRNSGGQDRMTLAKLHKGHADLFQGLALAEDHFADIGALKPPVVQGQALVLAVLHSERGLGRLAGDVSGGDIAQQVVQFIGIHGHMREVSPVAENFERKIHSGPSRWAHGGQAPAGSPYCKESGEKIA